MTDLLKAAFVAIALAACGSTGGDVMVVNEFNEGLANPALMPGVEAVQNQAARDHLASWHQGNRAPGSTFALGRLYSPGDATTVLVNQRVDHGEADSCRVLVHKVVLPHDAEAQVSNSQVGVACCDGHSCQLDAGGSMLALERALKAHDTAALAGLVANSGVTVTLGEANPSTGLAEDTQTLSNDDIAANGLKGVTVFDTLRFATRCEPGESGDAVECSCTAAGVQQRWRWARGDGGELRLTAIEEDGD